jgi:hypothetical protein
MDDHLTLVHGLDHGLKLPGRRAIDVDAQSHGRIIASKTGRVKRVGAE